MLKSQVWIAFVVLLGTLVLRDAAGQDGGEPSTDVKTVTSPILTAKLALLTDPRLFQYDINVEMSGTTLVLSGKVANESQKAAAGLIARSISNSVKNRLKLDKRVDREISQKKDEAIVQYVKDRFAKSKTLEKTDFAVKSEDGVVSLSGKTRFQVIVLEAAEAARQVPGVKAVKSDDVQLKP